MATIETSSGEVSLIGDLGVQLTDIAFDPNGNLFGISFRNLYSVNADTAETTLIGGLGIDGATGLVFGSDGTLYMGSQSSTSLFEVDTGTGTAAAIGDMGFRSGGDLAFVDGNLFLADTQGDLISIDLEPDVAGTRIGSFDRPNVFGIASAGGTLFGTAGTSIFEVDPADASVSNVFAFTGDHFGAAYGQAFFSEASPIPLPAPVAMLLGGIALLGAFGRRRRA
ncbi:MAG: hypothetical protein AAGB05_08205 [Pseudomonadota bacterium]